MFFPLTNEHKAHIFATGFFIFLLISPKNQRIIKEIHKNWAKTGKTHIPFWTLVTAFLKKPTTESLEFEDWRDLANCCGGGCTGGGGGTTIFLGESKTGCWKGFGEGVDGGVMNTVYGPILPIIGGGVESLLIAIEEWREEEQEWREREWRVRSKEREREWVKLKSKE